MGSPLKGAIGIAFAFELANISSRYFILEWSHHISPNVLIGALVFIPCLGLYMALFHHLDRAHILVFQYLRIHL